MLQFLREMLQGDVAFTLTILTARGFEIKGGVLHLDDVGVTIDDTTRGWSLVPWSSIDHINYRED